MENHKIGEEKKATISYSILQNLSSLISQLDDEIKKLTSIKEKLIGETHMKQNENLTAQTTIPENFAMQCNARIEILASMLGNHRIIVHDIEDFI